MEARTNPNITELLARLDKAYPDAAPQLDFTNAFELLIATILSAQCTDKQVNIVTKKLFADYPTVQQMAVMPYELLCDYIRTCGFFNTKAKHILATCNLLIGTHGGNVPDTLEELIKLPGVGRKTANVVLSNAFGKPAIAVDTHVSRVSQRLGLTDTDDVFKIEQRLMQLIPIDKWSIAHHWFIFHGRRVCHARKPECSVCTLSAFCKHYEQR